MDKILKVHPNAGYLSRILVFIGILAGLSKVASSYVTQNVFAPPALSTLITRLLFVGMFLTVGTILQASVAVISRSAKRNNENVTYNATRAKANAIKTHVNAFLSAFCATVATGTSLYVFQAYSGALVAPLNIVLPVLFVTLWDVVAKKMVTVRSVALPIFVAAIGVVLVSIKSASLTDIPFQALGLLAICAVFDATREHLDQIGKELDTYNYANLRMEYLAAFATILCVSFAVVTGRIIEFGQVIAVKLFYLNSLSAVGGVAVIVSQQIAGWVFNQGNTWAKRWHSVTTVKILTSTVAAITGFVGALVFFGNKYPNYLLINFIGVCLLVVSINFLPKINKNE